VIHQCACRTDQALQMQDGCSHMVVIMQVSEQQNQGEGTNQQGHLKEAYR